MGQKKSTQYCGGLGAERGGGGPNLQFLGRKRKERTKRVSKTENNTNVGAKRKKP